MKMLKARFLLEKNENNWNPNINNDNDDAD